MILADKVKSLPDSPGVYLMKDQDENLIYIGKASSLKKRVGSYFVPAPRNLKQEVLLEKVKDIDYITTASEAEALILEAGLIKEYKPKYNVAIKDDKAYPLLKLTVKENYPRLLIARRKKDDGNWYFGPYTSSGLLRQAVSFLRRIFPLRTCKNMGKSLCLNYHIRQCLGPCRNMVQKKQYREAVENLRLFLDGKKEELIKRLSGEMVLAAKERDFEKAAILRDQIAGLGMVRIFRKYHKVSEQIEELKEVLRLKNLPLVIEGFDISNILGKESVGSMVRFKQGIAQKSDYRRFKIRSISGIDDYAMIREIIERRYGGSLKQELGLPDLILIDGGKGHLETVLSQLEKMHLVLPAISIAKQFEHIYVEWQTKPLVLAHNSKALHLLMRIRDESHCFALSYHKILRKKEMLFSELDQIPGIGEKRRKVLFENMESLVKLKRLTLKQLTDIKGIDEKTAKNIIEYWKRH